MSSARHSQRYLDAVVANVLDGIIMIDDKGVVLGFNPAARRIFGYESSEVIGKNVSMLMPEPYQSNHDGYVSNYLRTGKARIIGLNREVIGLRKSGATFPMDLAVSEVRQDGVTTFVGTVHDISRHKDVQERLRNSEQRFELAVREVFA